VRIRSSSMRGHVSIEANTIGLSVAASLCLQQEI